MDDSEDQQLLKALIGKLYEYSITSTLMRVFISYQSDHSLKKEYHRHFRVVVCPYVDGYRGMRPDIPNMTILYSSTVPFIGTRDMKAHEVMPIVHRILTGEEKDGAEGRWLDREAISYIPSSGYEADGRH